MPEDQKKRKRGRPAVYLMPAPIPDTPKNVAKAIMKGPPKKSWKFMRRNSRSRAN